MGTCNSGNNCAYSHHPAAIRNEKARIEKECGAAFALPGKATYSSACQALLTAASATAGKFYVYDIYVSSPLR